jgi:hypothetical protein
LAACMAGRLQLAELRGTCGSREVLWKGLPKGSLRDLKRYLLTVDEPEQDFEDV